MTIKTTLSVMAVAMAFQAQAQQPTAPAAKVSYHNEGIMPLDAIRVFMFSSREDNASDCLVRGALMSAAEANNTRRDRVSLSGYCLNIPVFQKNSTLDLGQETDPQKSLDVVTELRRMQAQGIRNAGYEYQCNFEVQSAVVARLRDVAAQMYATPETRYLPVPVADIARVCKIVGDADVAVLNKISGAVPSEAIVPEKGALSAAVPARHLAGPA